MAKHYRVDGKKVIANIGALTEQEMSAVKNYIALGYEVVEGKVKVDNDGEVKKEWTEKSIREYIEKNGTEEQKKTYNDLYNKPTNDKATYKNDVYKTEEFEDVDGKKHKITVYDDKGNKIILHAKGEPRKQGHVGTLAWFKKTFPKYPNEK